MIDENCYEILGISWQSDVAEVKSAYRRLSKRHHPDLGGDAIRQAKLNSAKESLCDPVQRDEHDRRWMRIDPSFFLESDDGMAFEAQPKREEPVAAPDEFRDGIGAAVFRSIAALRERLFSEEKNKKAETIELLRTKRRTQIILRSASLGSALVSICACVAFRTSVPLLAAAACAYPFILSLRLSLDGFNFPPYDLSVNNIEHVVERLAEHRVKRAINDRLALWERTKSHFVSAGFRFSGDMPERSLAARLLLGFFSIGYAPREFDESARTLAFDDDGGVMLVRYRHREGKPSDIRYVKDVLHMAERETASTGKVVKKIFLFSTAGFSKNAVAECLSHGIVFYGAAGFKEWLNGLRHGVFRGPRQDIFEALAKFDEVMGRIVPVH